MSAGRRRSSTAGPTAGGTNKRGAVLQVRLPDGLEVTGAILSDQLKSLDWRARRAVKIASVPEAVLEDALAKIPPLIVA